MEIQVLNQSGSQDSKMELPDSIFGQTFNEDLVHQLITTYISNSHQGTKGQKIDQQLGVEEENLGSKRELVEHVQEQLDRLYGRAEV